MVLVDLRPMGLTGNIVEAALERAGITCNKNSVPFDPESYVVTSGIRIGTPAGTTRGFTKDDFILVGELMLEVLRGLKENGVDGNATVEASVLERVKTLCAKYPIY